MKAIVAYTEKEYAKMLKKYNNLRDAVKDIDSRELYAYSRQSGYAHYKFQGTYTDKLVEALGHAPDSDEIIMLIDHGFSHFGASCTVDTVHKSFSGRVNVD